MTDLITRARKEWLEVHKSPKYAPGGEAWHYYTLPCPPEVVAALLDVLEKLNELDVRLSHGGREALQAEAAIAKALDSLE